MNREQIEIIAACENLKNIARKEYNATINTLCDANVGGLEYSEKAADAFYKLNRELELAEQAKINTLYPV